MITTVMDDDENLWHAWDADAPQTGKCILCQARLYRRLSELGNPHYALLPGGRHAFEECRSMSDSLSNYMLTNTAPDDILDHYFGDRKLPGDPPETGSSGGTTRGPSGEKNCKVTSMAQLCTLGYLDSQDQLMQGNRWLSSVCISPKCSYMLLGNQGIGKRILQGRPLSANDKSQVIRMRIYIRKNVEGRIINRFQMADLHFADAQMYRKVKERLMKEVQSETTQGLRQVRRYNRIAVIADWVSTPQGKCSCGWSCEFEGWKCSGHLYAEITQAKCVYPIPNTKVS